MNNRSTPETDAVVRNAATADHPPTRLAATLTVKCEKLERERDKAQEDATNYYARIGELEKERDEARKALQRIADCDFVITLPDRMDAVRKIANDALNKN